ncbi:hypothetical protein AHAS_Ahas09G0110900 [Arachis hypogaea]
MELPFPNWITLNIDNSANERLKRAGCGGLLRDKRGSWIVDFSFFVSDCSAFKIEL